MKRHKCLDIVDAELAKHNTQLDGDLLKENRVFLKTMKIDSSKRGAPKNVVASFCPVCGKKLLGVG